MFAKKRVGARKIVSWSELSSRKRETISKLICRRLMPLPLRSCSFERCQGSIINIRIFLNQCTCCVINIRLLLNQHPFFALLTLGYFSTNVHVCDINIKILLNQCSFVVSLTYGILIKDTSQPIFILRQLM